MAGNWMPTVVEYPVFEKSKFVSYKPFAQTWMVILMELSIDVTSFLSIPCLSNSEHWSH